MFHQTMFWSFLMLYLLVSPGVYWLKSGVYLLYVKSLFHLLVEIELHCLKCWLSLVLFLMRITCGRSRLYFYYVWIFVTSSWCVHPQVVKFCPLLALQSPSLSKIDTKEGAFFLSFHSSFLIFTQIRFLDKLCFWQNSVNPMKFWLNIQ